MPSDLSHIAGMRLGFGCGDLFAGADEAASIRLVEAALDAGIRYFDVARLYGNGSAEYVLGKTLPRVRSRVVIASKAGILPWQMRHGARIGNRLGRLALSVAPSLKAVMPELPRVEARHGAFRLGELKRSVDVSLRTLRTDYLDILLLHDCTVADARRGETLEFLERLREQGKIRSFGIATHFDDAMQILNEVPAIARVAQFPSDPLNRNVTRIPKGVAELVVGYAPIKYALPKLIDHFAADLESARRWTERTGIGASDTEGIAAALLAEAVAQNAGGVVLYSSSREDRIRRMAAAVQNGATSAGAALNDEFARMTLD